MAYCKACLEKDLKIEELKETIKSLQAKLNYRERKEEESRYAIIKGALQEEHIAGEDEQERRRSSRP